MVRIAWSQNYCHPLPEGHRFPMEKYHLIPEQLLREGSIRENQIFHPTTLAENIALQVHESSYVEALKRQSVDPSMVRRIGFPLSPDLVNRELCITQGTIDCCLSALRFGAALNVAGGTHHAFSNRGEGFCLLNDIAVAAQYLLDNQLCQKILVIDLDVHQGNGTASIFSGSNAVFTFSMHGQNNYPLQKEISDLDIGLPDGIEGPAYLKMLAYHLPRLFDFVQPDFVFYQSGVDILETDRLGRLKVNMSDCKERDKMVSKLCFQHKVPLVAVMGGGYSHRLYDIVEAHCQTFHTILECWG